MSKKFLLWLILKDPFQVFISVKSYTHWRIQNKKVGLNLFHKKKTKIVFMCSNFLALVLGEFPPTSYIISDYFLYLEKFMVLA